jgi:Fe2+ transport system protein FeoA
MTEGRRRRTIKGFRHHRGRTPHRHSGLVPLSNVAPAVRAVIREVHGGRGFTARAIALGFTPGAEVTVVQNYGRGPVLVEVRQSRVALGRWESYRILVEELPEG